jgi:16S rRNA (cytidine1402-2'-O)-methyltransferase
MPGKLYVCGTPIGNLEDVSIRLLKTLRKVDIIICEDTRHTIKLLNRYKIKRQLISYHEHSSSKKEQQIIAELISGKVMALVSDAGMPTISDPGQGLIRQAIDAGIEVEVIPGPSACIASLAISGLDSSSFVFLGFLPVKAGKRQEMLNYIREQERTVIIYEAPHRLLKTLNEIESVIGAKHPIVVAREITKIHQEINRGSLEEVTKHFLEHSPRGELCILIPRFSQVEPATMEKIMKETMELIESGMDKKKAFKMKADEYKIKKSTIYKHYLDITGAN